MNTNVIIRCYLPTRQRLNCLYCRYCLNCHLIFVFEFEYKKNSRMKTTGYLVIRDVADKGINRIQYPIF